MRGAFTLFVAAVALALAVQVAPSPWLEAWTRSVLPVWAALTSRLHTALPFPVTIAAAGVLVLALLAAVVAAPSGRRVRRAAVLLVAGTGVLAAGFVLSWGVTYGRSTLAELLDLPAAGADVPALELALDRLVGEVHRSAPDIPLALASSPAIRLSVAHAATCVADVDEHVTGRRIAVPSVVRELPPGALLRAGFGGVALPWLLEPHVDSALPGASRLAVASHELVHTAGWAREADTDALSVLAALACDDPSVRYAAALHGAQLVAAAIATVVGVDHPARERVSTRFAELPDVARADRRAMADAYARYVVPTAAHTVGRVYDVYLRTQGVEAGIADYGNAGGLVAAALAACEDDDATARPWCRRIETP
jgi:hypothetical protein